MSAVVRQSRSLVADLFPGLLARVLLGVLGCSLTISAFGLWMVPGPAEAPAMALMKLGVSLFMLIAGMCCLVISRVRR